MLRLADTTLRLYRRRDGRVSVRWRSYLMIYVKDGGFKLSAYLNKFDMSATFVDGSVVSLNDFGYSEACTKVMGHMIHDAWAGGVVEMDRITSSAALLRVEYRLFSFDGQGDPSIIEMVAPTLPSGPFAQLNPRRNVA